MPSPDAHRMFQPPDQGARFGRPDDRATDTGADSWMVTWADAITVLMGFFVLLFSLAKVDDARFEEIRQALSSEVEVPEPLPVPITDTRAGPELAARLTEVMQASTYAGDVVVERLPAGVVVELPATAVFTDADTLRPDAVDTLATFAWELQQPGMNDYMFEVQVVGDWERGSARATALARFFEVQGVDLDRLRATAFGALTPRQKRTRGGLLPTPAQPTVRVLMERP